MEIDDARIRDAVARTEILRAPKHSLLTFGTTNIYYYLITEPIYTEITQKTGETVIREGKVIAERPRIITPYFLTNLEGFSADARHYSDQLIKMYGKNAPGLLYAYKNEPKEMNIVSDNIQTVTERLNAEIDKSGDPLKAIIKGVDELWDVALFRFIFEMTNRSVGDNINQLGARGLLGVDNQGVPAEARYRIDELFRLAAHRELDPRELKAELDRWGLFGEYEDQFLSLFRK